MVSAMSDVTLSIDGAEVTVAEGTTILQACGGRGCGIPTLCYGDTINFGEPVAAGSSLDGFVVFAPLAFDPDDARVDVGDDLPIVIVGMYPTYASEREYIAENGLEAFWKLEWDPYDVVRPPAV